MPFRNSPASGPLISTSPMWEISNSPRSEEHTSELQSHHDLVCRLLLEKKKNFRAYATQGSAAMDLRACIREPQTVPPADTILVSHGIAHHIAHPTIASMLLSPPTLRHQ